MWALGQAGFYDLSQGLRGNRQSHTYPNNLHTFSHYYKTIRYVDTVFYHPLLCVSLCLPFLPLSQQYVLTEILGWGLMKQQGTLER